MPITVKFFASLRETVGKADSQLDYQSKLNVNDIWAQASGNQSMPNNTLCAINMEYVEQDAVVADGDEVAFFPPVTGG